MNAFLPPFTRQAITPTATFLRVVGICLLLLTSPASAQTVQREYEIKSAFLYHFLQYAEWDGSDAAETAPLSICVLGMDPFGPALDDLIGKQIEGRSISVRRFSLDEPEEAGCHMAFFAAQTQVSAERLSRLEERGVLTVGEESEFTKKGGMIRLFEHRNRIRFEIDLDTVRRGGIQISSHVLRLARIV